MRIAIDARELGGKPTGVGRYLAGLLAEWTRLAEAERHTFTLYVPQPLDPGVWRDWGPQDSPRRIEQRVVGGKPGTWWEQVRLPAALRADRPDVLFAPGYTAPLSLNVPLALAIHDLSFLAHPEWFRRRERLRRQWLTARSAKRAGVVLTISEFSAAELTGRLGVTAARLRVVPPGVFSPPSAAQTKPERQPLVVFVGSIFNRRRLPDLIRAFAAVARDHPDARLEIIGENRTHPRQDLRSLAVAEGVGNLVAIRSYVSETELSDAYSRASVFGYLSEYEGFGLTPLEALASGVPAVVLDTAVARETLGNAALYVQRGNVAATATALASLLYDARTRAAVLAHASATLARHSWEDAARATLKAIEDAALGRRAADGAWTTPEALVTASSVTAPTAELTIIIVSYNTSADLQRCLESLRSAPPAAPHRIVIVDNASADDSVRAVRKRWPDVLVIETGANLGFARANNIGIRATAGEFVLLLNSDTVVPPGAIDRLLADLRSRPEIAVVGPRIVDGQGTPEVSFGRMMSPWNEFVQKTRGRLYARGFRPVTAYVRGRTSRAHEPDWVSGAALLVRRGDAEAVGLLDERYFMYAEDVDFCAAIRSRARGVRFSPVAEIVHHRGRSVAYDRQAANSAYRRSQIAFYEKHHPRWARWLRAYLRLKGGLPVVSFV